MKTAYAVIVQTVIGSWPYYFYLVDDSTRCVVGMFKSVEEMQVFADLHGYTVKDLQEAEPFKLENGVL